MFGWLRQARRLTLAEDRLRTVERDLADAKLDWDSLYEQMRKLLGRVSKRAAVLASAEEPAEGQEGAADPTLDRLDPVSRAIKLRRRGVRVVPSNGAER